MDTTVISDTDVIIDFFSGIEPVASTIEDLIQAGRLVLTAITVFELYAGITGRKRLNQIRDLLSILPVYPIKKKDAEYAATVYNELKSIGRLIGNQDILIAAVCVNNDIPLFSRNMEHFSRIANLRLFRHEYEI